MNTIPLVRTSLASIGLALCAAAAHAGPVLDRVKAAQSVRVCIWPDYYGVTFRNPRTQQLGGIDVDLSAEFGRDMKAKIEYVGHHGHEEAVGTMAVAPESIHRVESVAEVAALPQFDQPVALLAQTTLSHRDWADVAEATEERFPTLWKPGRSDLCFATTNRQSALMELTERCDAIVVVGSANSSNTLALEKLARSGGCEQVYRVNHAEELPSDIRGVVGLTAGASATSRLG